MKTKILILFLVSYFSNSFSQQIGSGNATKVNNFNTILPSGMYYTDKAQVGYPYEIQAWPNKHIIASGTDGTYQLQLSSPFTHDDRMLFRKVVKDSNNPNCNNQWYELATRGYNKFTDHQHIPMEKSLILGKDDVCNQLRLTYFGDDNRGDGYIDYSHELYFRNGNTNGNWLPLIHFTSQGNVGIGKLGPTHKLEVDGTICAKEVKVQVNVGADFVFSPDYNLKPLSEIEAFIQTNNHLPEIPSEKEMQENGLSINEFQIKLLQKIEELTLYAIQQQEMIGKLNAKIEKLENTER